MHRSPRSLVLLQLVGALLLGGCGADESTATPTVVRDSAGIRIVENGAPAWSAEEAWRLSAEPRLTLGHEGDERYQLGSVAGAKRLSDGRIAILDRTMSNLRVYSAAGEHLATMGRPGSGPGEFMTPSRLDVIPGDTLRVYDTRKRATLFYTPEGAFVRQEAVDFQVARAGFPVREFGVQGVPLTDGSVLITVGTILREVPQGVLHWPDEGYLWLREPGTAPDTLAWLHAMPQFGITVDGRSQSTYPLIRPQSWAAHGGGPVRVALGDSERMDIHVFEAGRPILRIRDSAPPPEVTNDELAAARAAALSLTAERAPERLPESERILDMVPAASHWPAHGRLHVDAAGRIWAETYHPQYQPDAWLVFDADGIHLGRVPMPPRVDVMEIGQDFVLAAQRDSLDVQRVVLFEVIRP